MPCKSLSLLFKLPIEIINEILKYSDDLIMIQYDIISNKEKYIINWKSDSLFDIKTIILMKLIYPLTVEPITCKPNRELYKYGKEGYKQKLKNGTFLYLKRVN